VTSGGRSRCDARYRWFGTWQEAGWAGATIVGTRNRRSRPTTFMGCWSPGVVRAVLPAQRAALRGGVGARIAPLRQPHRPPDQPTGVGGPAGGVLPPLRHPADAATALGGVRAERHPALGELGPGGHASRPADSATSTPPEAALKIYLKAYSAAPSDVCEGGGSAPPPALQPAQIESWSKRSAPFGHTFGIAVQRRLSGRIVR